MFITPAYAQAAGAPGMGDFMGMILPLVMIMGVFYFLLIRPQQKKMKEQQDMISRINRGDTVVTSGGFIGKVTKVVDPTELQVEIGENVKVRVLRSGIVDVRAKGEPVKDDAPVVEETKPAKPAAVIKSRK
jgi:preprotein translocase subunit YajC